MATDDYPTMRHTSTAWKLTFLGGLLLTTAVACTDPAASDAPSATTVSEIATPAPMVTIVEQPLTYTVVSGDFLSDIADRFEVSTDELATANGIVDSALIEVGQVLTIPGQTALGPAVPAGSVAAVPFEAADLWDPYRNSDYVPPPPPPPPPPPSAVEELLDRVAGWPWPPRPQMVTGTTMGAFALAALVGGFVLTKIEYGTRRWGVRAVPRGARKAFRWWGIAAITPRRCALFVHRHGSRVARRVNRWYRVTHRVTSRGWVGTAGFRRLVAKISRRAWGSTRQRVSALIDRAPDAADGLNAFGGRASTSVRRSVQSGAKRARRGAQELTQSPDRWRSPMAAELAEAFERGQLQVRYVPVIDLDARVLGAVEAHLFWQHPQRGLMQARDIYAASQEHPELGAALLEFLLEQSCDFLKDEVDERFPSAQLIVPITIEQIVESEPLAAIDHGLTSANLAIDRLKISITEPHALHDSFTAASFIRNLRSMGIGVHLDDYGGATVEELKYLGVSSVTVDFASAGTGSEAVRLLSESVQAAQDLRLPVTARHARMQAAQDLQVSLGCSFQAVGEPIPAAALVSAHVAEQRTITADRRSAGEAAAAFSLPDRREGSDDRRSDASTEMVTDVRDTSDVMEAAAPAEVEVEVDGADGRVAVEPTQRTPLLMRRQLQQSERPSEAMPIEGAGEVVPSDEVEDTADGGDEVAVEAGSGAIGGSRPVDAA